MLRFNEYDMVLVDYKGITYPMCIMSVDKRNKLLNVKSLRHDNFSLTVGFDDVEKVDYF